MKKRIKKYFSIVTITKEAQADNFEMMKRLILSEFKNDMRHKGYAPYGDISLRPREGDGFTEEDFYISGRFVYVGKRKAQTTHRSKTEDL